MTERPARNGDGGPENQVRRASIILVVVTFFWGTSFSFTKHWQDMSAGCPGGPVLASCSLIALRMALPRFLARLGQDRALAERFAAPVPTIKTWLHRSLTQLRLCLSS